jgi:hypothetical protein
MMPRGLQNCGGNVLDYARGEGKQVQRLVLVGGKQGHRACEDRQMLLMGRMLWCNNNSVLLHA